MAPQNATRRPGRGVSAMVIDLDEQITTEDSTTASTRQAVVLPTLADARARLLEMIRQRSESPVIIDAVWWQRNRRRADAVWLLRTIPGTTHIATVIGVTPQSVRNWRAGRCAPTPRHWRQLRALHSLAIKGT